MPRYIIGGPTGCQSAAHALHARHFAPGTPSEFIVHTLQQIEISTA